MTKELTDEDVAKALGWLEKFDDTYQETRWYLPDEAGFEYYLPKFTTSLDATTQEIERRGLKWDTGHNMAETYRAAVSDQQAEALTAPLALCKALMQYIEENK